MNNPSDMHFLELAITEAKKSLKNDCCPVGAVLVCDGKVIGTGYSRNKSLNFPRHAEINAIKNAKKSSFNISIAGRKGVTMYVSLEPCLMCLGTMVRYGISNIVYGQRDYNMWKNSPLEVSPYLKRKIKRYECIPVFSKEYYQLYYNYDEEEARRVFFP